MNNWECHHICHVLIYMYGQENYPCCCEMVIIYWTLFIPLSSFSANWLCLSCNIHLSRSNDGLMGFFIYVLYFAKKHFKALRWVNFQMFVILTYLKNVTLMHKSSFSQAVHPVTKKKIFDFFNFLRNLKIQMVQNYQQNYFEKCGFLCLNKNNSNKCEFSFLSTKNVSTVTIFFPPVIFLYYRKKLSFCLIILIQTFLYLIIHFFHDTSVIDIDKKIYW